MAFMISVTKSGLSGLTNAYRSVRSAYGSPAIMGASRWLDAPATGLLRRVPANRPAVAARPPTRARGRFMLTLFLPLFFSAAEAARHAWPARVVQPGPQVLSPRVRRVGTPAVR